MSSPIWLELERSAPASGVEPITQLAPRIRNTTALPGTYTVSSLLHSTVSHDVTSISITQLPQAPYTVVLASIVWAVEIYRVPNTYS
jgi:hypothetical protein